MKTQSTFTDAGWDFTVGTGIWAMSSTITFGGYPTLQWTNSYATAPSSNEIATLSNLVWVAESSTRWAASYTQTAGIVASSTSSWNSGAGWTPIGNGTTSFTGSYDGQGHTIDGLFINRPSTGYIGLFGSTSSSTIQNLGVTGVNITGQFNVGGLVGFTNGGTVSSCYSTGSVIGTSNNVGGLVGNNRGTFNNCYSTSSVSGAISDGGLVGTNSSSGANVSNCYSTGSVSGSSSVGGLVGLTISGTTSNSFWDTQTSGRATSSGGTGKTTLEMKTQSTFTDAGWNFSTIWSLSAVYNNGYPNLDGEVTLDYTWTGTSSTDWNTAANWDINAVPGIGDNVVILGSLTNYPVIAYGENGSCNDLTINNGGELKVDHGGSLITNGIVTKNGVFAIDLLISQNKWHMVSSPITGATANTFLGDYLQNWDEPTATWSDITDPATALAPIKGYSLWDALKFGDTYTFTGTPNTGNQNAALTYTNHGGSTYDGANLLGNPYPSSIDWSGLDDTYGAVYYWDGSAYVSWNNGSGSGVQYIPPMQGFFVVSGSSGTFNLTNNNRTHSGASFYYKSSGTISNGLVLEATGDNYNDALYLKLNEEAATGFELTRDAWKLPSNTPGISQLWSVSPEGNLSIDVRPYQEVIPLGFSNDVAGNYSISIKEMADLTSVILEDSKENTFTDLTKGAYHFKWDLTDDENRFKIHLGITGIQTPSQDESVLIYASGQDLYLRPVEGQSNGTLTLTDMAGRSVFQKQVQVSGLTIVTVNLIRGIYLVSYTTNTETLVKKVVVQ